jgi:UrcA family protein
MGALLIPEPERLTHIQESNMSTMTIATHSTRQRGPFAVAALTVLISSFGGVCNAANYTDVPTAIVKYGDLDISTSQGVAVLYNRIRAASEGLCAPFEQPSRAITFRWKVCVKQAIAGAVANFDRPALTAVFAAKYGVPQPAKILTADRS